MKYKPGEKVLYTCEDGLSEPVEALVVYYEGGVPYPYQINYEYKGGVINELACDEELSPIEPEQLRQREQFFNDIEPLTQTTRKPEENSEPDMVNHPPHYANKDPETIDMIRAVLTKEEFIGGLKWQILKYRDRAHEKGDLEGDMGKAKFYYDLLKEEWERSDRK